MSWFSRRVGAAAVSGIGLPFPAGSDPYLAALFVRWAALFSLGPDHPIADETGERADRGQPEDVWLLAGTFGGPAVTRTCTVPAHRPIFLPAFCMWGPAGEVGPVPGAWGEIVLDGSPQPLITIATPGEFPVKGAWRSPVGLLPLTYSMAVTGLWLRLEEGLEPGAHVLQVRGGEASGFEVAVTYRLDVTP